MFSQFKTKLQVDRIALHPFARVFDPQLYLPSLEIGAEESSAHGGSATTGSSADLKRSAAQTDSFVAKAAMVTAGPSR